MGNWISGLFATADRMFRLTDFPILVPGCARPNPVGFAVQTCCRHGKIFQNKFRARAIRRRLEESVLEKIRREPRTGREIGGLTGIRNVSNPEDQKTPRHPVLTGRSADDMAIYYMASFDLEIKWRASCNSHPRPVPCGPDRRW